MITQLLMGQVTTFTMGALARIGVADHMTEEPIDVAELAARTHTNEPALYRVLRLLASFGVFKQDGRRFGLAPMGEMLRSDSPKSQRNFAIMMADRWTTASFQEMERSIRTGIDGTTAAFGKHGFALFPEIPDQADTFHRAMTEFTNHAVQALLTAYDFRGVERLADVGGGHGILLVNVLRRYADMQGVLFDLPEVVAGAVEAAHFTGLDGRMHFQSGSFLETVPEGCDAYIMKNIVHDWDDERSRRILSLIRQRMRPGGRVLLYEMIVPDDVAPGPAKVLDMVMLACTPGGLERTASEYAELFASAGLRLERTVPTAGALSVLEARVPS
jgi:SAM-dependent methyltransferase